MKTLIPVARPQRVEYFRCSPFKAVDDFQQCVYVNEQPSGDTILYTISFTDTVVEFIGYVRIDQDYGTIGSLNICRQLVRTRQVKETFYFVLQFAYDMVGYRRNM